MSLSVLYLYLLGFDLCPPGCAAEDSDSGDERGELPLSGEQNEAHDSFPGAGKSSSPEDH